MLSYCKFVNAFLYNFYICSVFATTHNIIKGEKFICGTHAPNLVTIKCQFKRINRTTEFWSFDGHYAPSVNTTNNLFMNITVFARQSNLEWRPHMVVNYFVDVCKYMDGTLANHFLDILFSDLKRSSNVMHPCPYTGHFYLRNMTFNDEHFPPIVPSADIYVDFQYFMFIDGIATRLFYLRPYLEVKTKGIFYFK